MAGIISSAKIRTIEYVFFINNIFSATVEVVYGYCIIAVELIIENLIDTNCKNGKITCRRNKSTEQRFNLCFFATSVFQKTTAIRRTD
jgi:hypothetical protein